MTTSNSPDTVGHGVRRVGVPASRRHRRNPGRGERGYVAIVTAIVLPLMLLLAAFAIDTGIYYYRSNQLQRVADAAALAGVTRMPQFPNAEATARDVALRNGIKQDADHDVIVEALDVRKIKVTIRDRNISTFFGKIVKDHFDAERKAIAEYSSQIPLGSTLNAIGTGDLAPVNGEDQQNFWLSVSGFCTAKEDGDMVLSRYEGNKKNYRYGTLPADEAKKYVCPVISPVPADITDPGQPTAQAVIDAKTSVGAYVGGVDGMPELVLNRDFDRTGYNYIINVPCSAVAGVVPPPPCASTDLLSSAGGDLVVQVFDPVFDPGPVTDDPRLHKDQRRLFRNSNDPTGGSDLRLPSTHVTTEFRAYGPDTTPLNYDDDIAVGFSDPTSHLADSVIADTATTAQYGTCNSALGDDSRCGSIAVNPTSVANQWTTLIRFPAGTRRGRFRINVRTQFGELNSYGQNSFALRAAYAASATTFNAADWRPCTTLQGLSLSTATCPNIAGDTSMATNASATSGGPAEFYLAKLSPASAYRNKIIQVLLWDPGEGGEAVQILGPKKVPDGSAYDTTGYDPVAFTWKLSNPGINSTSQTPEDQRVLKNGSSQLEPSYSGCGVGTNKATYTWNLGYPGATPLTSGTFLDISGGPIENDGAGHSCMPFDPSNRGGTGNASATRHPAGDPTGRYNGRLVNIEIQIPAKYGLNADDQEIPLAFDGWWKIKYYPTAVGGVITPVTDRSTWTVQLIGDPVHLVRDN